MSEIFNRAVAHAAKAMAEDGFVEPILMGYSDEHVVVIPIARLFGDDRDMSLTELIKIYFLTHGITSYVLMHEAKLRYEPAQGAPRKVEAVMVVEVTRDGQSVSVHEIQRDPSPTLIPFPLKPGTLSGKLMSMLPTDDFAAEEAMVGIAESVVNSMGSRKLPLRRA